MSHITCPFCKSTNHTQGYGPAGPMGSYTFCDDCNELIEFAPDLDGMDPKRAKKIQEECRKWRARVEKAARKP